MWDWIISNGEVRKRQIRGKLKTKRDLARNELTPTCNSNVIPFIDPG